MEIAVWVEPISAGRYRASTGHPLHLSVERATRDDAVAELRHQLTERLARGELVKVQIPSAENPVLQTLGGWKNDPTFDEFLDDLKRLSESISLLPSSDGMMICSG